MPPLPSGRLPRRLSSAVLVLLVVLAAALSLGHAAGVNVAEAAIQRANSFIQLMHQRSPGTRIVAHLAKTKHRKLALHERALPKVRKRAPQLAAMPPFPSPIAPALVDIVAAPIPVEMASLEAAPVGPFDLVPGGPPGFFLPSTGGFIIPPAGTPGSPVITPPVVSPPVVPPPVVAEAVPEPGAWMLMLVGFTMIGFSLRAKVRQEHITA